MSNRGARAGRVLNGLHNLYPDAKTELDFRTPFELLVSTMLSAQATDVSVNSATPALFEVFPDAPAMAVADPLKVESYIRTIGLFRTKARNVVAASALLLERHGGEVPKDMEALTALPGVGRKTANVVLANAFGVPTIAVDTHVGRVARRLGFTKHTDPDKVESDLQRLFPESEWVFLHHGLILHGRRVCKARTPLCGSCPLCEDCLSCGKFDKPNSLPNKVKGTKPKASRRE